MKKWIILVVCAALLSAAIAVSIAVVSAQGEPEPESSVNESENPQLEYSEKVDIGDDMSPESDEVDVDTSLLDVPEVVTLSHMMELTGAERSSMELTKAALELYAGQNVKYRVQFYMSYWADHDMQDEYYRKLRDGSFGTVYAACIYLCMEGYPSYMYAELTEEALREILAYEKTVAYLIDEIQEEVDLFSEESTSEH